MALTNDQIESMTKGELAKACRARGLKYGSLSLMQQRELLKENRADPPPKEKKVRPKQDGFREGSKAAKCAELFKENPKLARKDMIDLFMKKGGLTSKAAANTYYQNIKGKLKPKAA